MLKYIRIRKRGDTMERYQEIERSIITKFRKDIWSRFVKAVSDYELIKENDNVMVCISGGKDSFLLAKCIEELIKHGKFKFTAHYVVMDPGYNSLNRKMIEENAKTLNISDERKMCEILVFYIIPFCFEVRSINPLNYSRSLQKYMQKSHYSKLLERWLYT